MHLVEDILVTILKHSPITVGTKAQVDIAKDDDVRIDLFLNEEGKLMIGLVKSGDIELKLKHDEKDEVVEEVKEEIKEEKGE